VPNISLHQLYFFIQFLNPHTSAASAALRLASSAALPSPASAGVDPDPNVRGGPPTFFGSEEMGFWFCGGAEESMRPGWEKGSEEDSLEQRLPISAIYRDLRY
jgi:hypothetical protein